MKTALLIAMALGAGSLILQRWVASTRIGAIALVIAWFVVVTLAALVWLRGRPELRRPVMGTIAVIALGTVAVGYWTGFRDREVDEDVLVATADAEMLKDGGGKAKHEGGRKPEAPDGPVSLAAGQLTGQDGHAGSGNAEVISSPDGERTLVFTDFDVDPGVDVQVYLTPDTEGVDDRVELGGLKGNIGDQQYSIPGDADLSRYDSVVLWCTPFTVRIATAELQ
jgi:hypothetical protein